MDFEEMMEEFEMGVLLALLKNPNVPDRDKSRIRTLIWRASIDRESRILRSAVQIGQTPEDYSETLLACCRAGITDWYDADELMMAIVEVQDVDEDIKLIWGDRYDPVEVARETSFWELEFEGKSLLTHARPETLFWKKVYDLLFDMTNGATEKWY